MHKTYILQIKYAISYYYYRNYPLLLGCSKKNLNASIDLLSTPQSGGKMSKLLGGDHNRLLFLTYSVLGCQPEKNYSTLRGGQSHSWSAEQEKIK